jgi:hypothetical protein
MEPSQDMVRYTSRKRLRKRLREVYLEKNHSVKD